MKRIRILAATFVAIVVLACAGASLLAPSGYAEQSRYEIDASPSHSHWLGTDDLGRDRFARLLHGTRVSLFLAPVASLISVLLAAVVGGIAGYVGGIPQRAVKAGIDLFLSLPWLLLLLVARAMLPLNVSPMVSVVVTFALLGTLGWAGSARVLSAGVQAIRESEFVLQARASGISGGRLLFVHVLPNVRPILIAQFWISVPIFILTEANLGLLGLGVAEPLPSWGSLLRELGSMYGVLSTPWKLTPLVLLVIVVTSFQLILSNNEVTA